MSRVWVVSEIFYPSEAATSHYLTWIACGLARTFDVQAICVTPPPDLGASSSGKGVDTHEGICIHRISLPKINAQGLFGRALTALLSATLLAVASYRRIRRGDVVLVVTNPPLLPALIALICSLKRAKCVVRVDDVYPEAMIAAGVISARSMLARSARALFRRLYSLADRIIVLGRDMGNVIEGYLPSAKRKIVVITNWADVDSVAPAAKDSNELLRSLGLRHEFVALVAGNVGRVQGIETIVEAASLLKDESIHILVVGSGAREGWLKQMVRERCLRNLTVIGPRPRQDQSIFLNACDVAMLSLKKRMYGIGVPSRLYNYMAAGKPVVGIVDANSEPALAIEEDAIGWVVPPGDFLQLSHVLREAKVVGPLRLQEMGRRARAVAESRYAREAIIARYVGLFAEVAAEVN